MSNDNYDETDFKNFIPSPGQRRGADQQLSDEEREKMVKYYAEAALSSPIAKRVAWGAVPGFEYIKDDPRIVEAQERFRRVWNDSREAYNTGDTVLKKYNAVTEDAVCKECDGTGVADHLKDDFGQSLATGMFRCRDCGGSGVTGDPVLRRMKKDFAEFAKLAEVKALGDGKKSAELPEPPKENS